jgi:hypothetical protein
MSQTFKIAFVIALVATALGSTLSDASARGRLFPLARCGPDLADLCPIRGYFNSVPFHYSLAIYPGCLRTERVETPYGMQYRRVLVCG